MAAGKRVTTFADATIANLPSFANIHVTEGAKYPLEIAFSGLLGMETERIASNVWQCFGAQ